MLQTYFPYIIRIIVSAVLGLAIGYERELQKKSAGVRDVALITVGATMFTIFALELAAEFTGCDIARIVGYIIASMGFLGSGIIIQRKGDVEGLTTAATLWAMVATGLFCGIGNYVMAVFASVIIYLILKFKHVMKKIEAHNEEKKC